MMLETLFREVKSKIAVNRNNSKRRKKMLKKGLKLRESKIKQNLIIISLRFTVLFRNETMIDDENS